MSLENKVEGNSKNGLGSVFFGNSPFNKLGDTFLWKLARIAQDDRDNVIRLDEEGTLVQELLSRHNNKDIVLGLLKKSQEFRDAKISTLAMGSGFASSVISFLCTKNPLLSTGVGCGVYITVNKIAHILDIYKSLTGLYGVREANRLINSGDVSFDDLYRNQVFPK